MLFASPWQQDNQHPSMTCYILKSNGDSFEVEDLSPTTTVRELRKKLFDLDVGVRALKQRLAYANVPLQSTRTLSYYNIKHLSVLYLKQDVVRPRVRYKKPVILLYPQTVLEEVSVRVGLRLDWRFCALYPRPSCKRLLQHSEEYTVNLPLCFSTSLNGKKALLWFLCSVT